MEAFHCNDEIFFVVRTFAVSTRTRTQRFDAGKVAQKGIFLPLLPYKFARNVLGANCYPLALLGIFTKRIFVRFIRNIGHRRAQITRLGTLYLRFVHETSLGWIFTDPFAVEFTSWENNSEGELGLCVLAPVNIAAIFEISSFSPQRQVMGVRVHYRS